LKSPSTASGCCFGSTTTFAIRVVRQRFVLALVAILARGGAGVAVCRLCRLRVRGAHEERKGEDAACDL
jgi:hypothetical protein